MDGIGIERWEREALEAFRASLLQNGVPAKVMYGWLIEQGFWTCSLDAAKTRFHRCLDPDYTDCNFKLSEYLALTQHFGGDDLFLWDARRRGYDVRKLTEREVTDVELREAIGRLDALRDQVDALSGLRDVLAKRLEPDVITLPVVNQGRVRFRKGGF